MTLYQVRWSTSDYTRLRTPHQSLSTLFSTPAGPCCAAIMRTLCPYFMLALLWSYLLVISQQCERLPQTFKQNRNIWSAHTHKHTHTYMRWQLRWGPWMCWETKKRSMSNLSTQCQKTVERTTAAILKTSPDLDNKNKIFPLHTVKLMHTG